MTGVALIGAGIFATTQHLPAIQATNGLELLAVYSRSQQSAETLSGKTETATKPVVYFDNPPVSGQSLNDLLAREDIKAVIVCVPILAQPEVIRKALTAGKHVLSEKPIAPDVSTAGALVDFYSALPSSPERPRQLWGVAENFRYLPSLHYAAERIKVGGGRLVAFHLIMNGFVSETDEFYNTEWRKTPNYQGGFLLDAGVHFLAALRYLLASADDKVQRVACFSSQLEERLAPVDSIHAVAATHGGINGTISTSFGTEFKSTLEVCIVTTKSRVTWNPVTVQVAYKNGEGKITEEDRTFPQDFGVVSEVAAFSKGISAGCLDSSQSPQEAIRDLELLEALLTSGPNGAVQKL